MKHLNEELLRINELMGNPLKEKIKIEESTPNIVRNLLRLVGQSSDDIARGSDDIAKLAGRTAKTDWVSKGFKSLDDAVAKAKAGDKKALSALVSDTSAAYTNIAVPFGKNIFDDYVRLLDDVLKDPVKYGLNPNTTNLGQGTRRKLLQMVLNDSKSVTQGARTAGKGLTNIINNVKNLKPGSKEFIRTVEQNIVNNKNITNIYINQNYTFIVDDLVKQGMQPAAAKDMAMSIILNRPVINVNQKVINQITKIDDFVVGNRNNLNIVNIENNTIKNIKAAGAGKSSVLRVKDLSDDVLERYREYERIAKKSTEINPKTGRVFGYGKDGKWNPSEAARQRWIRQAMDDAKAAGQGGAEALKGLSWKNWLAIGAAVGLTGTGLWLLLRDDEEVTPEDLPNQSEVSQDVIVVPGISDETSDETASDSSENNSYYEGELGSRVLKRGSKGEDVKDLQRRLNKLFISFGLVVDGDFGSDTEAKVKEFQRRANIKVDGVFGPESFAALLKMEKGGVQNQEDNTASSSSSAPEDNLESIEPIIVTNIENKRNEIADAGLTNIPEEELIVVQAPENVAQSVTDKVVVRGAKQCPDGKKPVLVKSKEKEVNRKNRKKRKTVAIYRCRKV